MTRKISDETRQKNRERSRRWREQNPDYMKGYMKAYRQENGESMRENDRAYHAANREQKNEYRRRWRLANPERNRAVIKAWADANPDRIRELALRKYGITLADYNAMLERQGSVCAICDAAESRGRSKTFHVDHDHVTGKIRGLLCHGCNTSIGHFRDDPALLERAIKYLASPRDP